MIRESLSSEQSDQYGFQKMDCILNRFHEFSRPEYWPSAGQAPLPIFTYPYEFSSNGLFLLNSMVFRIVAIGNSISTNSAKF